MGVTIWTLALKPPQSHTHTHRRCNKTAPQGHPRVRADTGGVVCFLPPSPVTNNYTHRHPGPRPDESTKSKPTDRADYNSPSRGVGWVLYEKHAKKHPRSRRNRDATANKTEFKILNLQSNGSKRNENIHLWGGSFRVLMLLYSLLFGGTPSIKSTLTHPGVVFFCCWRRRKGVRVKRR